MSHAGGAGYGPEITDWSETVHYTDSPGRHCAFCGANLVGPDAPAYPPGVRVVRVGQDPCATWRTTRRVSCRAGVQYFASLPHEEQDFLLSWAPRGSQLGSDFRVSRRS